MARIRHPKDFFAGLMFIAFGLGAIVVGSDYPFIPPERWLADFEEAGFRPQVHDKVLRSNAQRALGLA